MKLECTNCGAEVPIEERTDYLSCEYCKTALYVETDQTVLHYLLPPEVADAEVEPLLAGKLLALEVGDPAEVTHSEIVLHPFWRFERQGRAPVMVPAAEIPAEELGRIDPPFGGAKLYSEELVEGYRFVPPTTLLAEEAAEKEAMAGGEELDSVGASLVHVALIRLTYSCQNREFEAVVEGVSGALYADEWPAAPGKEKSRLMAAVAGGTFVAFLVEGVLIESWMFTFGAFLLTAGGAYLAAQRAFRDHGW